ncbi:epimerase [candidate division KSB1 bacterium]|nr:MAG: epimerase [candidate division KSB1 bacterium]
MAYLVTGGAGFIGSHLCERLVKEGSEIICVDNFNDFYDPLIKRRNVEGLQKKANFKLYELDILDFPKLQAVFEQNDIDVIIHLAARAGVRPSIKEPLLYQEVNVRGTLNLLELARRFNVPKFVFASSSSVYGNNKKVPFSEQDNVDNPVSPYAATKKAGELLAYTYHHLYDISISCIRFFTVYGPRQRPDMAIHKFTKLIDQGKKVPIFGDGNSQRDYTYISDIIDGLCSAIEYCQGYEIYNLGDSRTVELKEVIQHIENLLNKKARLDFKPFQAGDVWITYADISKAKAQLKYQPKVMFEKGMQNFIDWYKSEGRNLSA